MQCQVFPENKIKRDKKLDRFKMKAAIKLIQNISYKDSRNHVYARCQSIFGILLIVRLADSKGL